MVIFVLAEYYQGYEQEIDKCGFNLKLSNMKSPLYVDLKFKITWRFEWNLFEEMEG